MFGRSGNRERGLYDASMSHPAHGGFSIWQRRLLEWRGAAEADAREREANAARQDVESSPRHAERARPRDIWEEQERFKRHRGDDAETDPAGNPLA